MTYQEANDIIDECFGKAWSFFNLKFSEDAVSICKECEHDQSCRMTEIIDYSDSTIVNCNFYKNQGNGKVIKEIE